MKTMKTMFVLGMALVLTGCVAPQHRISRYQEYQEEQQLLRQGYVDAHSNLEPEVKQAILAGNIRIGMTEEEVRVSWGKGQENQSGDASGTLDQWFYGSSLVDSAQGTYLYFKNGYLVSYQKIGE